MFSLLDQSLSPTDRVARREWLRVGGLSALGVSLPHLLRAAETPAVILGAAPKLAGELGSTFGKAKNVIFLWLQGGPPQHETFDPPSRFVVRSSRSQPTSPEFNSANCCRERHTTPTN